MIRRWFPPSCRGRAACSLPSRRGRSESRPYDICVKAQRALNPTLSQRERECSLSRELRLRLDVGSEYLLDLLSALAIATFARDVFTRTVCALRSMLEVLERDVGDDIAARSAEDVHRLAAILHELELLLELPPEEDDANVRLAQLFEVTF